MPRQLTFRIGKREYAGFPEKIDRKRLYGWTEVLAADEHGAPCDLLTADESGKYVIPPGGTANGILSEEGRWVERAELRAVDGEGKPAQLFASSFSRVNELTDEVSPQEFLDYDITDFYRLTGTDRAFDEAVGDRIYRFEYAYNDSYDPSPAFVMAAQGVLFLLIGRQNRFEWLCFGDCETIDEDYADNLFDEEDPGIDFSMF